MCREEIVELLIEYTLTPDLFEKYDLRILDIIPKRGVYRIETDKGCKCLKRIKYEEENLYFIHQAIEHLVEKGFTKVSRIRRTKDGHLFLRYGEHAYVVMDWIDGRECDFENPIELDRAVKVLTEFHHTSKGFIPQFSLPHRWMLGKWPQVYEARSRELLYMKGIVEEKEEKNQFDHIFLKYVDYYYTQSLEAIEALKNFDYDGLVEKAREEKGFCHNDYAHHNILISYDNRDLAVLDFDYCLIDLRINDIADLIHRNLKKSMWDIERAEFVLNSYHRNSPLSDDEKKGIYAHLLFPRDFWRIASQHYIEKKVWSEETYLGKIIEKAECKELREDFLKAFKKMTRM